MVRFGTYTIFKTFEFRLIKKEQFYSLIYNGKFCPLPEFKKYTEGIFYLDIPKLTITNAFSVRTYCLYKGYQFDANTLIDENHLGIVTDNKEAFEKLNLDFRDRGVFQKEVAINELEKLWEERSTYLNFPFPENFPTKLEIKIPKK
jgi:hypothetical protein